MTDEMRVALFAVALAAGTSAEEAWRLVDDLPEITDLRATVVGLADRVHTAVWRNALPS